MSELFSATATLLMVAALCIYLRQIIDGSSTPNPATWLIVVVVMVLNTITYLRVVEQNLIKALVPIVVATSTICICLYALTKGKFGRIGKVEKISFALAVGVGVFWQVTDNAKVSNLLLQAILLISFCPTIIGLYKKELKEKALAWDLAVASYALMVCAIIADWQNGAWASLAYPVLNGILGNGSVSLLVHTQTARIRRNAT